MTTSELIQKYNVPGPRYTSYPPVPYWNLQQWEAKDWISLIRKAQNNETNKKLSLYIHLPYCDSLCTFCGCHKHITKNHQVEERYIDAVLKEWLLIAPNLHPASEVEEIHLGGGTPTFFAADELVRLINGLKQILPFSQEIELSFEAHPNSTTKEHLEKLNKIGFRRISFGIQDYDPIVQQAIHRIQPAEQVFACHEQAKKYGFSSISHDLVFGLPKQSMEGFKNTVKQTLFLKPNRISLYSYAHVPWVKGTGQRGFDEADLPSPELKRRLYEYAKNNFLQEGYREIGMDHFALPDDALAIAAAEKKLHRNFMGYTTTPNELLIGLGMSAISDCKLGFAQNEKTVSEYLRRVEAGELPLTKGHQLNERDLEIRWHILNLMCRFETIFPQETLLNRVEILEKLSEMINDKLISIQNDVITILPAGIPFVRNCCMAFDTYFEHDIAMRKFSMTI
ncbi:oxygen-independent coproporphyrinogen III oxidase [Fluviicola sp.]|uniref:oxygen-independent coproporphyrinogen III oxidase n=1 Tax=Fluviicola sp. TaxID=1917219 RepID=UPI00282E55B9|nr:oxygen-independent coproporphyrinogen III oxidase [Fluviicola sp.]MDR0800962.1 oxygen-independent coproporphyrinogen III oxidase [Fluviicola sp.]